MSVASAPLVRPQPPSPKPEIVQPRPKKPSNSGLWIGWLLAVVMLAGAALIWQRRSAPVTNVANVTAGMRTAKVLPVSVEKTLRVTGATSAENFVSLVTPQLRGSRSDRLRDTSGGGGGGSTPSSPSSSTP